MTPNGEGGDEDEDALGNEATSFASLLGDTKPLAKGPRRLPPAEAGSKARRRVLRPSDGKAPRSAAEFRWPDPEDRHRAAAEGVNDTRLLALSRGQPQPEERIDLHGTRREMASRLLAKRLASACAAGLECVLVIHGQGQRSASGEAVLRDALPDWLTRGANARAVLAFAPAPERLGGAGATLVLLRRD